MNFNYLQIVIALIICVCPIQVISKEHVTLGINSSTSKGFYYQDNKLHGEYGGQLQCVLDKLSIHFEQKLLPVARLVASIETGVVDVAVGLARTVQRDKSGHYSEPVMTVPYALISGAVVFSSSHDIRGKSLAVLRSSNMVPMAIEYGGKPHELSNYPQIIKMVLSKRVDGALVPENVISSLNKEQLDSIKFFILKEESVGFYVSRKSPHRQQLINLINANVQACK
ncbi:transporter substrate-binding domain-containing protein [Thalassotalea sp. M1531]|uniref:Transporter substrate-binding domain-containing protein n=1 Tax=Thalassotalea algicola TaxID=2716224 RepID=A0A7Y0LBY0_9GAMM|nr:transporter substrate-binding domain-containing protein [Thalassotalea algicola]NMP31302.1 transporter substrate-binding domain-containing protein [Thalassotalea algicola]